ncbi:MAG: potassium transporter Kup [Acidimicrobiales bacterium]|nr:potassium transporter Kup [Acidimicrobiales bacterium]
MTARTGQPRSGARRTGGLALGALGVVYGDIGTSPLYALRESFEGAGHELAVTDANVLGVLSLILWSLITVISIKYLVFVMRADNNGEGGILALTALVAPADDFSAGRRRWLLVLVGVFGTALLYGDGMITPAISVLSAVEGTEVVTSGFDRWVIPLSVVILVGVFAVQRRGTGSIGKVFGPVMIVWFAVLGLLGALEIGVAPEVLRAINPTHAVRFLADTGFTGFFALGSVFLVVTGGEALFADMGHFGRFPITLSWYAVVLPGLVLNYFGQGALLLSEPAAIDNPFYRLAPEWAIIPLVVLATAATVIASQALISGAFSLTHQAAQLGYLPRLRIIHTSAAERGQVYVPAVNWILMVACVAMVVGFGSSTNLAAAYGVAVTMTMAITTVIFYAVARHRFGWSRIPTAALCGLFLVVDLAFFGANIPKIPHGGWFPLVVGGIVFTVLTTWRTGRRLVVARLRSRRLPLEDFATSLEADAVPRVPGTAVYLFSLPGLTPPALVANHRLQGALPERIIVLAVETAEVPKIQPAFRVHRFDLGGGVEQAVIRFGFMDTPDVPRELRHVLDEPDTVSYVLGAEAIIVTGDDGMARWREQIYALMHRNATTPSTYFGLPPDRTLSIGSHIEL